MNINTSMIDGNFAQGLGLGGGIFNNAGRLTLTASRIDSVNIALAGGGIFNDGGDVALTTSVISSNLAILYGGGLFNAGTMSLSNTTVISNIAGEDGGGFENQADGLVDISGSTIAFNQALGSGNDGASSFGGGGIDNFNGAVTMTNSTLSGNATAEHGGSLYNNTGQQTTLTNVTVSFNEAALSGGGFYNDGEAALKNTLVSNNVNGNCDPVSAMTSLGHNLDSENSCDFASAGDLTNTIPNLGLLQDNGGKTKTHALPVDSPAIDAGTNTGCPAIDQRGVTRPVDGDGDSIAVCDIGAYEAIEQVENPIENQILLPVIIKSN